MKQALNASITACCVADLSDSLLALPGAGSLGQPIRSPNAMTSCETISELTCTAGYIYIYMYICRNIQIHIGAYIYTLAYVQVYICIYVYVGVANLWAEADSGF